MAWYSRSPTLRVWGFPGLPRATSRDLLCWPPLPGRTSPNVVARAGKQSLGAAVQEHESEKLSEAKLHQKLPPTRC